MPFPGWSESNDRLQSSSIAIVGPQKHRSPTDLGKFGRPKNVRRPFTFGFLRLPVSSYAYIRQLSREERRKNGGEAESVLSPRSGVAHFRLLSADLCRAFAVFLRVIALTFAYLRSGTCRSSEERPWFIPRHGPLIGTESGQKRGRLEAIQGDNRVDQKHWFIGDNLVQIGSIGIHNPWWNRILKHVSGQDLIYLRLFYTNVLYFNTTPAVHLILFVNNITTVSCFYCAKGLLTGHFSFQAEHI